MNYCYLQCLLTWWWSVHSQKTLRVQELKSYLFSWKTFLLLLTVSEINPSRQRESTDSMEEPTGSPSDGESIHGKWVRFLECNFLSKNEEFWIVYWMTNLFSNNYITIRKLLSDQWLLTQWLDQWLLTQCLLTQCLDQWLDQWLLTQWLLTQCLDQWLLTQCVCGMLLQCSLRSGLITDY